MKSLGNQLQSFKMQSGAKNQAKDSNSDKYGMII